MSVTLSALATDMVVGYNVAGGSGKRFRPEPRLPPRGREVINSCGDASTASPAHAAAPLFARN